jgi:hypothetical protein
VLAVLAVAAAVAAAVAIARAAGPAPNAAGDDPGPAPTTTAAFRLERLDHRPGDCVSWDQHAQAGPMRAIVTAPCTEPHLIELTGRVVITDEPDHVPTDDELDALTDRLCLPVDEAHLGGRLDPHGRYYSAGIQPSPEGWRAGDREVWCGLGARDGTEDPAEPGAGAGEHRPFRGPVSVASQFWLYDRGSCLAAGRRAAVACVADHEVEIVGRVELSDQPTVPALDDRTGWDALLGERCAQLARAYLGQDPVAPLTLGWLGIDADSWAAGQRAAHCLVGERAADGGWVTVRGSARSIPS